MLKIAWSGKFAHPLPVGHRFPMEKYNLLPEQLLYEGTISSTNLFAPGIMEEEHIVLTHDKQYWSRLKQLKLTRSEARKTGFPLTSSLVDRETLIAHGTIEAVKFALEYGCAMNVAGGTHHAFTNRGEGFCLLNDQAIAANYLLSHDLCSRILIIDLDVHQGNGTAEIFQNEDKVFTFSIHGANNYPMTKESSDWDIPLPDGTGDKAYLIVLEKALKQLMELVEPDFMFFQAGVDVLGSDRIGRLGLSLRGCRERDAMVFKLAFKNKIPIVACMGGGYSSDVKQIVEAHANTFRLAQETFF